MMRLFGHGLEFRFILNKKFGARSMAERKNMIHRSQLIEGRGRQRLRRRWERRHWERGAEAGDGRGAGQA